MIAKILKNSLKAADDGRVEVTLVEDNRSVRGYIEQTFFEDAFGGQNLANQQKVTFTENNLEYLEIQFRKLLKNGATDLTIR